jgi:hypothetical protein
LIWLWSDELLGLYAVRGFGLRISIDLGISMDSLLDGDHPVRAVRVPLRSYILEDFL